MFSRTPCWPTGAQARRHLHHPNVPSRTPPRHKDMHPAHVLCWHTNRSATTPARRKRTCSPNQTAKDVYNLHSHRLQNARHISLSGSPAQLTGAQCPTQTSPKPRQPTRPRSLASGAATPRPPTLRSPRARERPASRRSREMGKVTPPMERVRRRRRFAV